MELYLDQIFSENGIVQIIKEYYKPEYLYYISKNKLFMFDVLSQKPVEVFEIEEIYNPDSVCQYENNIYIRYNDHITVCDCVNRTQQIVPITNPNSKDESDVFKDLDTGYLLCDNKFVFLCTTNSGLFIYDRQSMNLIIILDEDNISSVVVYKNRLYLLKYIITQLLMQGEYPGIVVYDIDNLKKLDPLFPGLCIQSMFYDEDKLFIFPQKRTAENIIYYLKTQTSSQHIFTYNKTSYSTVIDDLLLMSHYKDFLSQYNMKTNKVESKYLLVGKKKIISSLILRKENFICILYKDGYRDGIFIFDKSLNHIFTILQNNIEYMC